MTRLPSRQPFDKVSEYVRAFASVVGISPGLLGLRQINNSTFSLLLDTKIIHNNVAGRDNITYETIALRIDTDGKWSLPEITDDKVTGRKNVNLQEAVNFGSPYIKKNMAKQKATFQVTRTHS